MKVFSRADTAFFNLGCIHQPDGFRTQEFFDQFGKPVPVRDTDELALATEPRILTMIPAAIAARGATLSGIIMDKGSACRADPVGRYIHRRG